MRTASCVAGVLGLVCSVQVAAAPPAPAPAHALQCERLFDSRSGQLLDARTVVVREGKVAEVLPGKVQVPGAW